MNKVIRIFFLSMIPLFWMPLAYADSGDMDKARRALGQIDKSESDFKAIKLGGKFDPNNNGYEPVGKIPAAPGVRVDAFKKSYLGGIIINLVGILRGVVILKVQQALQENKAECLGGIVTMVEGYQMLGIKGWENYWRKDYEVPVYRVRIQNVLANITCRLSGAGWYLEYSQSGTGEPLKKLLR